MGGGRGEREAGEERGERREGRGRKERDPPIGLVHTPMIEILKNTLIPAIPLKKYKYTH